jgi:predicted component of type VI protein secretion system
VIIEVPVQPIQAMGEEERIRSIIILVAAGILIIALLAILILLLRRTRYLKATEDEYVQEAYFKDINGYTDKPSHKLGSKPAMMGRVAGKDSEHLDYIVIPESTIGRRHALIEYKDYSFWIIDQGSINGTFVNDQPVSTETRLKHGDRIRLHKCEFEFSMPEMEDSGKTMISKTVIATGVEDHSEDVTAIQGGHEDMMDLDAPEPPETAFNLDIDITSGKSEELTPDQSEEDTIIRDMPAEEEDIPMDFDIGDKNGDPDSADETIMLDEQDETTTDSPEKHFDDDDATLRPDDD